MGNAHKAPPNRLHSGPLDNIRYENKKDYELSEAWLERLEDEYDDLSDKIDKISDFMVSETYFELDAQQQTLIFLQYNAMNSYRDILDMRFLRATR